MAHKKFHLWLDESGEFADYKKRKGKRPSLVGGILFQEGDFFYSNVRKLFEEETFHSTEKDKNISFEKFRKIAENEKVIFVEICNMEYVNIIDTNLTYQNIMAQGLVQIIRRLQAENKDGVELDILIASRGDCVKGDTVKTPVTVEQYSKRLEERLILEGYHQFGHSVPVTWNIRIANAKKEKCLMIADVVCNSFLTKDTKYKGAEGDYINQIRNDKNRTWLLSVFEKTIDGQIRNYLSDNRLSDAVLLICQEQDAGLVSERMEQVKPLVAEMNYDGIKLQNSIMMSVINYYINSGSGYAETLAIIRNVIQFWLPILEDKWRDESFTKGYIDHVKMDLYFYMDTLYSHTGDIAKALECEEICGMLIKRAPLSWDNLSYRMKYQNRTIQTLVNMFEYERALEISENLIDSCETIKEALGIIETEGEKEEFDELAKAYGTRAQIHMFMERMKQEHYEYAVEDSDRAIEEFGDISDKQRQYSYRVHIETDHGNYDKALDYLYLQCGLDSAINTIRELCERVGSPFVLANYVRLMAEGKRDDWNYADTMYTELCKFDHIKNMERHYKGQHPEEIIFWKLASYLQMNNALGAADEKYKLAEDCAYRENSITLNVIGIAISMERVAMNIAADSKNQKEYKKVNQKIRKLRDQIETTCDSSMSFIREWLDGAEKCATDPKAMMEHSRQITL